MASGLEIGLAVLYGLYWVVMQCATDRDVQFLSSVDIWTER